MLHIVHRCVYIYLGCPVTKAEKGCSFLLKGFIREPKPPKKGIRVLLGILDTHTRGPHTCPKKVGLGFGFEELDWV